MAERHACCKTVRTGLFQSRLCRNAGTIRRGGKWYCKTHDPVTVKAKADARESRRSALEKFPVLIRAVYDRPAFYGNDGDWCAATRATLKQLDDADAAIKQLTAKEKADD